MFGIIDIAIVVVITMIGTALICLFIAGSSKLNHEEEAYREGYDKGYADGKKVGVSDELYSRGKKNCGADI